MQGLIARFEALAPTFAELCKISGISGLSLGVAHRGEIIHQANFGHRDVAASLTPNEETIFTLGSLTKAITSAMVGILVDDKKLSWDTKLHDVLPEYKRDERDPLKDLTITDLLSHRSGLPGHDSLWFLSDNRIVMKRSDAIPMFNYMPPVHPFRAGYCYNNFAYEIAGQVVEKLSGNSFGEFLQNRIVKPLGLTRTFAGAPPGDTNVAKAYMSLQDGSSVEIPLPFTSDDGMMVAAGGVRSSVSDLLRLYQSFMEAGNAELEFDASEVSSTNPLKEIGHLWQGQINFPFLSLREYTYASGWCRTQLPGPLALPSSEKDRSQLPLVLKGAPSRLTLYHEGSISGSTTFSAVFPETMSSVVVLANSVPLNYDGPRFVAELLIETMFGITPPNITSILDRSQSTAKDSKACVGNLRKELEEKRTQREASRPINTYLGRYYNAPGTFFLEVAQGSKDGTLEMKFYGVDEEAFPLDPYQDDSFTWLTSHDEISRRGRYYDYPLEYYIIKFDVEKSGETEEAVSLAWQFESGVDEPEKLKKRSNEDGVVIAQKLVSL